MRYAIFSDIYGNRQAWEALSSDLDRQGVDMPICLGDVGGYGSGTSEILQGLRARTGNIVLGFFDAAVAGIMDSSGFDEAARRAIEWTRSQLDREALAYLAGRPLALETGGVLFVHSECVQPGLFRGVADQEAARANFSATGHRITFLGHASDPGMFRLRADGRIEEGAAENGKLAGDCRFLIKVGSVGEPSGVNGVSASYVIYDNETEEVFFRRVPFDSHACRSDLLGAGLPLRPWCLESTDLTEARTLPPAAVPPVAPAGEMIVSLASVAAPVLPVAVAPPPEPVRRNRGVLAWLALAAVIMMVAAIGIVVARKVQEDRKALASSENKGQERGRGPAKPPPSLPVPAPVPATVEEPPAPEPAGGPLEVEEPVEPLIEPERIRWMMLLWLMTLPHHRRNPNRFPILNQWSRSRFPRLLFRRVGPPYPRNLPMWPPSTLLLVVSSFMLRLTRSPRSFGCVISPGVKEILTQPAAVPGWWDG